MSKINDIFSALNSQINTCAPEDTQYPHLLRLSLKKPPLLYYRGNIEIFNNNKNILAIIGCRSFSEKGQQLSYITGQKAAENNFIIVNGLAAGCDCEALKGALNKGGKCAVILPCGLDQIVPKCNESIAKDVLESGGCLISEYPPGTKAARYQYVERDRLQSGISNGVLVVETHETGGTMHTVNYAKKQHKRLACYYGEIIGFSSGNQALGQKKGITTLMTEKDLTDFLHQLKQEIPYKQLSIQDFL